jgi:predicted glycosyl hydrolase (DUF1957 family)
MILLGGIAAEETWPPQINYCPDFLSLKQVGTNYYCVDAMGVSSLPRFTKDSTIDPASNTINFLQLTKDEFAQQYVQVTTS